MFFKVLHYFHGQKKASLIIDHLMEGGRAITLICNPHICRVLLGAVRFFRVLWGTGIYKGMWEGGGTGATAGYWGVLGVLGSNSGYWWILWGTWGTKGYLGYSGGIAGTVGYCG